MGDHQKVEHTINEALKQLRQVIPELYRDWNAIGYSEETQEKFSETVIDHHMSLLEEMLAESKERKHKLEERIDSMTHEIEVLSRELSAEINIDCVEGGLIEVAQHLQSHLDELLAAKESRLDQFKELHDKELEICQIMGVKPVGLDSTLPSEEELQNYEAYILTREDEMLRLKNSFEELRVKIMRAMDELDYSPKCEFERLVVNDHKKFTFTCENMNKLENLNDEINEKLAIARETADKKRQELKSLLDHLEVTDNYDEFFQKNCGCDHATILSINREIKRYREIRTKNIEKYIEKIRGEIIELWDLCKFSNEQRKEFSAFNYKSCSEDILTLHELELERLKKYYEDNKKIFELFYEYEEILRKKQELDLRADDPDRLNNRGGQLLEEEKSRKMLTKNMAKVLAKLKELLVIFEADNGEKFTFDGVSHEEYVERQRDEFILEKENLKMARAKAKDEKKSVKKTPLSVSRRIAAMSRTLGNSVKRKLPMEKSPVIVGSHKKRLVQSEKTRPTACGSKIRRSGRISRRILGNSFTRTTPKKSTKVPKITLTDAENSTMNAQQYEEFQEHLADRNELRSTLLSEQVLNNAGFDDNKRMKTPVKTPVKPLRKHLIGTSTPHITPRSTGPRRPSRSPRITSTPKLTAAPSDGLSNLKL